ncbi:endonuclease domain-containing protein [Streptomyces sp. NPDC087437]|uniref:endonuclease domain-containing protein n=1 Tax=Streptomyces sp. NPDC087437 TaxID=3365789 RepID=UPI0037FCDFD8
MASNNSKNTTQAGYGYTHQALRRALLPAAYGQPCPHCQQPMLPGQPLDLDHTADRTSYRGFAHASCNRSEGARRGNAQRRARRTWRTSRQW